MQALKNENNRHACEPYTCECCECGGTWMVHIPGLNWEYTRNGRGVWEKLSVRNKIDD